MSTTSSLTECLRLPLSTTSVRIKVSTVTRMESTPPNPQWNFTDQVFALAGGMVPRRRCRSSNRAPGNTVGATEPGTHYLQPADVAAGVPGAAVGAAEPGHQWVQAGGVAAGVLGAAVVAAKLENQ